MYLHITNMLQFRFETPKFSGRVPSDFTPALETEYLKEADIKLSAMDDMEEIYLMSPFTLAQTLCYIMLFLTC